MSLWIVGAAARQEADRTTIERLGLPSLVLMETAARSVASVVAGRDFGRRHRILCGPGNNGGDGLALARVWRERGIDVEVALVVPANRLSGDAARQLELARNWGLDVTSITGAVALADFLADADVVVDALLGTGLTRPVKGEMLAAVAAIAHRRRRGAKVVAVDIPSGLDASSGAPPGEHVVADLTVTFAALGWAHVLAPAAEACGEIVVADIGIPPFALADQPGPMAAVFDAERLRALLPRRRRTSHKGSYGHLLLLAGTKGKAGAAILAARSALRSGVGLLTVAAPEAIVPILQAAVPEAMTVPLDARRGRAALVAALADKSALAAGPGLGTGALAADWLDAALAFTGPRVLDADALNLLAAERCRRPAAGAVFTPHPGEAARLLGRRSGREIERDRPSAALEIARRYDAIALLKGSGTLVANPGGQLTFNPSGNPGLATGGSGDVLTGLIGALLARGLAPFDAAGAGAYLHGSAGDALAASAGEDGLIAGDLPDAIAAALRRR